ncbi:MAG: hypothetical protein J6C96_11510 [Oscillospiraceae bacterium]|nr:hypothetical protein [Oscillospiraceae bacterium]
MSKSIKDYKDAMDSIKISDSFYKRTELLLKEKNEILLETKPAVMRHRITAAAGAIAACIICVVGARLALNSDSSGVITETALETIESITVEEETASPVIDVTETEEDALDEAVEYDDEEDIAEDESVGVAPTNTNADAGAGVAAVVQAVEAPATEKDNTSEKVTTAVQTEKTESAVEEPVEEEPLDLAVGVPDMPLLSELESSNITAEITPYFNMDGIKSGESSVKQTGVECVDIIDCVAEISRKSKEISNYSFVSVFSVSLSDKNSGETLYSIYVTDKNAVVITKHSPDGQHRVTYGVNAEDFENLRHMLYLRFGSEENYELFKNLVSGK